MLEIKLHRKVAAAADSSADLGGRLALRGAPCPGGEEAVATEVMQLGQDRDHSVIGSLDGKIVEVAARRVGERRCPATDFEPRLTIEKRVETTDRPFTAPPDRVQRLHPCL